jgi:hypothetical protein
MRLKIKREKTNEKVVSKRNKDAILHRIDDDDNDGDDDDDDDDDDDNGNDID